ncbi:MAG: Tat pathway signal protein [Lachnospiraceae bacterium]|jgi:hypothetical protein|nr:Tat pathway signal protein [Lachnospiraceae bacterium]NBJ80825.1 Tat pathway signal protein [bacterium 1XD42-76]NBK04034.1 Tat pathway signal protein [bacterium 1XD42-94]
MRLKRWLQRGVTFGLGVLAASIFGGFESLAYDSASLSGCRVENGNSIVVTGTARAEEPSSEVQESGETQAEPADDGYYYLFELAPYESGIGNRTDYAAWSNKGGELRFTVPYSGDVSDAKLYSRFVTALKIGDSYREISNPIYVTNPGDMAAFKKEFPDPMSKKGLLIELDMLGDAMELGVKHTTINIPYHHLMGGELPYQYNGRTYYFNQELIESYDRMISAFSNKGIVVTAILLNGWNEVHPELVQAGVPKTGGALYYGFNVSTKEGFEATRALFSFMAERYSGAHDDYGRVSNWIIGNEVNNNRSWNYVGPMDLASYTKLFEKCFRVAYTAIKSHSSEARVYFSTDFYWRRENTNLEYGARDLIDAFNAGIRSEGNIDWGLAYHPYPYPLTEPEFWDDAETGMVTDSFDSTVVNFANLNVLTDYFQQDVMRTDSGQVRHIILSEEGFTSISATRGDVYDIQAAAFAYAYYLVDSNPYIDAFILNRQVDAAIEVAESCAFGIWTLDTERTDKVVAAMPKNIYNVFKYIDTKQSLKRTEFAKEIIGISSWSEVIPNFKLEQ